MNKSIKVIEKAVNKGFKKGYYELLQEVKELKEENQNLKLKMNF
jgi:hypothetical protein